jgi:hypothetical protein
MPATPDPIASKPAASDVREILGVLDGPMEQELQRQAKELAHRIRAFYNALLDEGFSEEATGRMIEGMILADAKAILEELYKRKDVVTIPFNPGQPLPYTPPQLPAVAPYPPMVPFLQEESINVLDPTGGNSISITSPMSPIGTASRKVYPPGITGNAQV